MLPNPVTSSEKQKHHKVLDTLNVLFFQYRVHIVLTLDWKLELLFFCSVYISGVTVHVFVPKLFGTLFRFSMQVYWTNTVLFYSMHVRNIIWNS